MRIRLLGVRSTVKHIEKSNAEIILSEQLSHNGENHSTKNERFFKEFEACFRYSCFHDSRDPVILFSISVQTDRELYLQIRQEFVMFCLGRFLYLLHDS